MKFSTGLDPTHAFPRQRAKAILIAVHYKSVDSAVSLLRSVQQLRDYAGLDVMLVDNSSGEEYVGRIRPSMTDVPNSELVECEENLGYFGAARFCLERYLSQKHDLPDWVMVCNHDVVIEDREFFAKLFAHDSSSVGVIGPRIRILESGLDQNPFMRHRPGRLRWSLYRLAKSSYAVAVVWDWMGRLKKALKSVHRSRTMVASRSLGARSEPIYAAHGSFLIFSRRYFEAGGYLDDNMFLYGEEISVAEICRSLNLPVIYEPSLLVLHDEHHSTGRVISRTSYQRERDALRYVRARYLRSS